MNRSLSFLTSVAIHALIVIIAWWGFDTVRISDKPDNKIRISFLLQPPSEQPSPAEEAPVPPPPPPKQEIQPPAKAEPRKQQPPIVPAPVTVKPETIRPEPPKPAAPSVSAPAVPPVTTEKAEPKPVQPSPPPVNVQAKYEEDNLGRIRTILAERLTYPKNALRLHQQGEIVASFSLTPEGEILHLSVAKSSEFELLDTAALRLIETSASSFPKPSKTVRITVPIVYKIR